MLCWGRPASMLGEWVARAGSGLVLEHPQMGSLGAAPQSAPAGLGRLSSRDTLGWARRVAGRDSGAEGLRPACLESQLSIMFSLGSVDGQELTCACSWDEQPGILAPVHTYKSMNSRAVCVCNLIICASITALIYTLYVCTPGLVFWEFGTYLLIGFELHIPFIKNLSDNCSPQGPEIPCLHTSSQNCLLLLRYEYFGVVILHQVFCCCLLHKRVVSYWYFSQWTSRWVKA